MPNRFSALLRKEYVPVVFTVTMGGKTIATVEISLKDYSIVQYRAFANKVCEYTEQIADIINANKKMIAERKRA